MLEGAIELKKEILLLKDQIQAIEEENDLPGLRDVLKNKEGQYQSLLHECYDKGVLAEGSLRVVTLYRGRRKVRFKDFYVDYPDIAMAYASVRVADVEKDLTSRFSDGGMEKKDAKEKAQTTLEKYCDMEGDPKFDVVDMVEGI